MNAHQFYRSISKRQSVACCIYLIGSFLCYAIFLATIWFVDAIVFGADEGYELIKASLVHNGFQLYSEIWNDQPPLHTLLISGLFDIFGQSAAVARTASATFSLILLLSVLGLIRDRLTGYGLITAFFVILTTPFFMRLSLSAMLELPMLSLALLSAFLAKLFARRRRLHWLLLSGATYACSLHTKLIGILWLPYVIGELLSWNLERKESPVDPARVRSGGATALLWIVTVILCSAIVWCAIPQLTLFSLMSTHFPKTPEAPRLSWHPFLPFSIPVLLAFFGAGYIFRQSRAQAAPVFTLAIVPLLAHLIHRPFWSFYTVHFALPIAWLCGIGIDALIGRATLKPSEAREPSSLGAILVGGVLAATCLLYLTATFDEVLRLPRVAQSAAIRVLREDRGTSRWIYCDRPIYAFHANRLPPPSIAIIPEKRWWTGQIDAEMICSIVEDYLPGQLAFSKSGELRECILHRLRALYSLSYSNEISIYKLDVNASSGVQFDSR